MFAVEEFGVQERVQLRVEGWVVEVLRRDEVEQPREGEQRRATSDVVAVCKEVHQDLGTGHPGKYLGGSDAEK